MTAVRASPVSGSHTGGAPGGAGGDGGAGGGAGGGGGGNSTVPSGRRRPQLSPARLKVTGEQLDTPASLSMHSTP